MGGRARVCRSSGRKAAQRRPTWEPMFITSLTLLCCKCPFWQLVAMTSPSDNMRLCSFGPNTFPAHNSVLFASEVQVEYLARTLLAPIIDRRISSLDVKVTAETQWVNRVHSELREYMARQVARSHSPGRFI